jgi:UDP-glucose:(heptosyl)LPS alpha-1,3-glucosyltransferase
MKLLHIVRLYGPVGGMERYVWELTGQLAKMGHAVTILCQSLHADAAPEGVEVIELGDMLARPRWLAHLRFSHRVSGWIAAHPDERRIIHSHERTAVHHFTTFHAPPFAAIRDRPLWRRCSPRNVANLWLERREVCGAQITAVIPNSRLTADALLQYYPGTGRRMAAAIYPGVGDIASRPERQVQEDGGVIGFIGREWKRKGLDTAVQIIARLRRQRPKLEFLVAGPDADEVRHLFRDWRGGYRLLGAIDSKSFYAGLDLLLHPARQEPYGMVIAEARAAGTPVLVSDHCGIAPEIEDSCVLAPDADINIWVDHCNALLGQPTQAVTRNWKIVAEEQIACYQKYL